MSQLYLHGKSTAGETWSCFWALAVEHKITDIPRSGQTQTGYGKAIPTQYMVRFHNKWRRVYCAIFSNSGTLYIKSEKDTHIIVRDYD